MNKTLKFSLLAIIPATFAAPYVQAATATAQGGISATIASALQVQEGTPMSFGTIIPGNGGTVSTNGTATGVTLANSQNNPVSPDMFNITQGSSGGTYTVTGPSTTSLSNGSQTMNVTLSYPSSPPALSSNGTGSFNVDGTLSVAKNQQAGFYTGSYNITVNY